ncbi:hypothetical protein E4T56_gene5130 [Termitomyces sp. T112]|nr:hypothetical protein E4T56_gene5130 [Termitomyces sp. T112]
MRPRLLECSIGGLDRNPLFSHPTSQRRTIDMMSNALKFAILLFTGSQIVHASPSDPGVGGLNAPCQVDTDCQPQLHCCGFSPEFQSCQTLETAC